MMLIGSAPHVALQESSIDLKVSLKNSNPMGPKTLKELQTGVRGPVIPVRLQVLLCGPRTGQIRSLNGSIDDFED